MDYLCWRKFDEPEISIINLKELGSKEVKYEDMSGFGDKIRKLNVNDTSNALTFNPLEVAFEEPTIFYVMHSRPGSNLTDKHLLEMSNHLMVTIKDKAVYFDLNQEAMPIVNEFLDMKEMGKMQQYVESGHLITRVSREEKELSTDGVKYKE